jgi:hypothetical protein
LRRRRLDHLLVEVGGPGVAHARGVQRGDDLVAVRRADVRGGRIERAGGVRQLVRHAREAVGQVEAGQIGQGSRLEPPI